MPRSGTHQEIGQDPDVACGEVRRVPEEDGDTPDGQGSLLDHSLFMYGSNMSNSDQHSNYPNRTWLSVAQRQIEATGPTSGVAGTHAGGEPALDAVAEGPAWSAITGATARARSRTYRSLHVNRRELLKHAAGGVLATWASTRLLRAQQSGARKLTDKLVVINGGRGQRARVRGSDGMVLVDSGAPNRRIR